MGRVRAGRFRVGLERFGVRVERFRVRAGGFMVGVEGFGVRTRGQEGLGLGWAGCGVRSSAELRWWGVL